MALAFRSFSNSTAFAVTNPLTVTAPSGMAAGDFIVLISALDQSYYPGTPTPSGFGAAVLQAVSGNGDRITVWTKVADANDVSTGSFGVPNASGGYQTLGCYAFTGASSTLALCTSGTGAYAACAGYTPTTSSDILICGLQRQGGSTHLAFQTANNNPTWTGDYYSSAYWAIDFNHATYGYASATGSISSTASDSGQIAWFLAVTQAAVAASDRTPLIQFGVC